MRKMPMLRSTGFQPVDMFGQDRQGDFRMKPNPWKTTLLLAGVLTLAGLAARQFQSSVRAEVEAAPINDSMLINTTEENDRLILVDLKTQNIMVYRTLGVGQFRLINAHCYKYDLETKNGKDTSRSDTIEKKGITYLQARGMYESAWKPK
jgi:hypothetical protein